jgi:xylulose-5-phosphate/fructose-6-phosphate phosphoketolase
MVVLNDLDRFHLVMDVIDRVPGLREAAGGLREELVEKRAEHRRYIREHGEDMPEIRNWRWDGF